MPKIETLLALPRQDYLGSLAILALQSPDETWLVVQASLENEQNALFEKYREQWEAESRETKESQPEKGAPTSPRDKTLRPRGSMVASALNDNPQIIHGRTGSKGSEEAHVKLPLDESMDMPLDHKCSLLECSAATCWVLKAGSKSTRKRPETPDSSD